MSFQIETTLKSGKGVTLDWDGYIDCDGFPEFTQEMAVSVDDGKKFVCLNPDDLCDGEWDELIQCCVDHMIDFTE